MSLLVALFVVLQLNVLALRPLSFTFNVRTPRATDIRPPEGPPHLSFTRRHVSAAALLAATTPAQLANAADTVFDSGAGDKLSRKQIEGKLSRIPVIALVNGKGNPVFTDDNGQVGFFYLDPIEAGLALRVLQRTSPDARFKVVTLSEVYYPFVRDGNPAVLGGELRIRPPRKQVALANRVAKKSLSEKLGQVPIFYSELVTFVDETGTQSFPFFLVKEDLDKAYTELRSQGKIKGPALSEEGFPVGRLRVATLDGLVGQMTSGELDLSQAVIIGSSDALVKIKALF